MERPLLSICIPTFNRAQIVYECVRNCLNIPYEWIDVVVTDNCSNDQTQQILQEIDDKRFKYYRNESNIGYINLTKCLTNGDGEFCLLLSDEDDFVDVDWINVKEQLIHSDNISIFQFKYLDESEVELVSIPSKKYVSNELETFKKVFESFPFAGGMIVRNDIFRECWHNSRSGKYLWSLYNEIIVPLYCVRQGDYCGLSNLTVKRGERNNKGALDNKAVCGESKNNEPYWSAISRIVQFKEWINFFYNFGEDNYIKIEMSKEIIRCSIFLLKNYHNIVYGDINSALFIKHKEIIFRDRKKYKNRWIRESFAVYKEIAKIFDDFYGEEKRDYISEKKDRKKVTIYFIKQYLRGRN